MINELLKKITSRTDLTQTESAEMLSAILSGEVSPVMIAALISSLSTKGETFAELAGAARAMRSKAHRIQVISPVVVDTCGTGGDASGTFNISTAAAFVVAGAGITVAKHGNRSISSKCGSADVLEELGVNLEMEPELVEDAINEIGIGFMFAPKFHGAMKYAMPVRKELGIRSIFNMLGPLTNPAGANYQVLGVFAPQLTEMFAEALKLLGCRSAAVVHGHDGLDEISVCDATRISELKDGMVKTYELLPEQFFGEAADLDDLKGGEAPENAKIIKDIYSGRKGPARNVVVINAAAAISAAGKAENISQGVKLAEEAIDTGNAAAKLDALIRYTQEN
ncbi:Anthranilate phosphoribosyltransferase [Limihaloglobus sulfuriphilus]|uniref:Anthranilate phosphoribosyltransferase n=1 Tax=Limihaloglobus sulfuriphilus TaxID=1851148 RepID=A0A1Q2MDK8_9BACT|nr:anthranilate phosphoribosyltransferase [Limihaloglobus sulfuriphilus]AQQ70775.1 Anthranilate phosphoribosyltransferase [Limihaloglobus sulfuriphilus]